MEKKLEISEPSFEYRLNPRRHDNEVKEGKLIEVFRGGKEVKNNLGRLEYIAVHTISIPRTQKMNLYDRMFYVWQGAITFQAKNNTYTIPQGQKFNALQRYFPEFKLINTLEEPAIVVEFASGPGSTENEDSVRVSSCSHDYAEIGSVEQITLHILEPGDLGGCHYHTDGKKEFFGVVEGEVKAYWKVHDARDMDADEFGEGCIFTFPTEGLAPSYNSHAIKNRGKGLARLVELSNLAFDPDKTMQQVESDDVLRRYVEKD